jgi:hypothetical protein
VINRGGGKTIVSTGRYVSHEVRDWLGTLRTALPPTASRADGTCLDRHDLIDEIEEFFAHHLSAGPDYSRSVVRHVQDAVGWFAKGEGDLAGAAVCSAYDACDPEG